MGDKTKSVSQDIVGITHLRKEGFYTPEALYGLVNGWYGENKYAVIKEDHTRKIAPDGGEIKVNWEGFRNVDTYFRFWIKIELWVWKGVDVLVEKDGKKQKMNKGKIEFQFKSWLQKNYRQTFSVTRFGNFLRRFYEKYVVKERYEAMEKKLYFETQDLIAQVQEGLEA